MFKVAMSRIDSLRQLHAELIAERIRIETQQMLNEGIMLSFELKLRKSVPKELAELTKDFKAAIDVNQGTSSNWQEIANELRESAAGSVRSISHKLWSRQPIAPFPDLTPFEIIRIMFSTFIRRQKILDGLQPRIDKCGVRTISENNETIRLSNDMAKYLHGNLQSRLMASAFAIEAAGNARDSKTLSAEIEKARQSIATPFDQFTSQDLGKVSIELSRLLAMWEGVLVTKIEFVGSAVNVSIIDTRNIVHVVEEAFSNALRHGLATEAMIVLNSTPSEISLAVIDNGIGPRAGDPGLGSSLFNSIAGSNWSLSRGPEGIGAKLNLQISK